MGRRKPYPFGTQNEETFKNNVKKNNNGKNGNGTGNKTPESGKPGPSNTVKSRVVTNDPFKGITPGMTKEEIKAKIKENNQTP